MTYIVRADRSVKDYGTVDFKVEASSEKEAIRKAEECEAEEIDWFVNKSKGGDENFRVHKTLTGVNSHGK